MFFPCQRLSRDDDSRCLGKMKRPIRVPDDLFSVLRGSADVQNSEDENMRKESLPWSIQVDNVDWQQTKLAAKYLYIYNIKLLEHTQQQQLFMCTGGNTQLRTLITWAAYSWQHLNHQGTLQLCQDLAGKTDLVRQERAMTIKRKRERECLCVCKCV